MIPSSSEKTTPIGWEEMLASSPSSGHRRDTNDDDDESSKRDRKGTNSIGKSASHRVVKKLAESDRPRADSGSARDRPGSPAEQKRKGGGDLVRSASASARSVSSDASGSPAKSRAADNTPPMKEIVEKDAIWLVDPVTDVTTVRACTLDRAIDKLILESLAPDQQQFLTAFVLTFRFFTTAEKFFELIVKRFDLPPEPGDQEAWKRKQQTARLRVCIVLRYWLANSFSDFDEKLLKNVIDFIEYRITPILTSSAQTLLQLIERRRKGSRDPPAPHPEPLPRPLITAEQWNLKLVTSLSPIELARQLTLLEHEAFCKIRPQELVKQAWLKPNKEQIAPNIVAAIKRFNLVSNWISTEVLTVPGQRERVTTIEFFIRVAQEFMTLQNFCGVLQVLSALQQTPVLRLKDTWKEVSPKANKTLQELGEIFQPLNNWKLAREALHRSTPPAIPYTGIFLTDLVMFDEGLPDMERDLLNFEKFRKIAGTIQEIQTYQNVPYWLESLPFCREALLNLQTLPDRELYERSYAIVPKQGNPKLAPSTSDTRLPTKQAVAEAQAVAQDVSAKLAVMHASMSTAVGAVLEQRFGRAVLVPWTASDKARYVYSWTDEIKIETVEHDGMTYIVHARLQATRAEISTLQRLVQFFKTQTGLLDVKGLFITLVIAPEEQKMAHSIASIELALADLATGVPLAAASGDSSETHSGGESPMNPSPNPLPLSPVNTTVTADWSLASSVLPTTSSSSSSSSSSSAPPTYTSWKAFLEAAEVPDDSLAKYARILETNAIELDQMSELSTEILRGLGFKMGHILKINKAIAAATGVVPK